MHNLDSILCVIVLRSWQQRAKHETLRDREAEMVSAITALEEEKEKMARGVVMAQERLVDACALNVYLVHHIIS